MNKAELVAQVAKESDLSKDAAEKAVDATFKNIEKSLQRRRYRAHRGLWEFPGRATQSLDRPQSAHRCRGKDPCFARAEIPGRQSPQRGLQQLGREALTFFRGGVRFSGLRLIVSARQGAGRLLYLALLAGRLAQLEERLVYTQEVGSSRLSPPTNKTNGFRVILA